MSAEGRRIIRKEAREWGVYPFHKPTDEAFGFIPLTYDEASGTGTYLMRMDPGAVTEAHKHQGYEDFLILEGELIDDDGTVLKAGDMITYPPGSYHNSRSDTGCTILVCEWEDKG